MLHVHPATMRQVACWRAKSKSIELPPKYLDNLPMIVALLDILNIHMLL